MTPEERIAIVKPVCAGCRKCDGFLGPGDSIVVCVKNRISLCAGACPRNYWDASNINKTPVVHRHPKDSRKRLLPGPGDVLKLLFAGLGFTPVAGCGCRRMQSRMNQWGWDSCMGENRHHILKFLQIQSERAGKAMNESTVLSAFNRIFPSTSRGKDPSAGGLGADHARAL